MQTLRSVSIAERNVFFAPPNVIVVGAAASTEIFKDTRKQRSAEVQGRYLQNVGANPLYYSFNVVNNATGLAMCDAIAQYHGYLQAGQQLDCTHRCCVAVYSVLGTTVATTLAMRNDSGHNQQL